MANSKRLLSVHRIHYRKGGAESVHLDHLRLFRDHGWDCAEFAMQHPDNEPSSWADYFPSRFEPDSGSFLERMAKVPRFMHSSEAAACFDRMLADFKPDIIHIHGLYQQLTASVLKPAKARGIPTVFTLHDFKLVCPAYYLYNQTSGICEKCKGGRQWNALLNRCSGDSLAKDAVFALDGLVQWYSGATRNNVSAFVTPSRFMQGKMTELGLDAEKLHYIPNFFQTTDDTEIAPSAIEALRARHGRFVLYFGRLSREKGVDVLIEAASHQGMKLLLVGDGPQRADLEAKAKALQADVTFVGHQRGAELWSYVTAASVVVLPSVCYENAPKSLLEAQSRGRIVIASKIGGMPEMIDHGTSGFLVTPGDPHDLAGMIGHVLSLPDDVARDIGEAGRVSAQSTFTSDRYFREMVALYESLGSSGR